MEYDAAFADLEPDELHCAQCAAFAAEYDSASKWQLATQRLTISNSGSGKFE
jgi:hypothetical protein